MPDPYSPIREELARLSGTLSSGLQRRSDDDLRRQQMMMGHESTMLGLGMQKERLGMESKRFGQEYEAGEIGLEKLKSEQEYGKQQRTMRIDLDQYSSLVGGKMTEAGIKRLDPAKVEVNEDGSINYTTSNENWSRIAKATKEQLGEGELKQSNTGEFFAVFKDGRIIPTGFTGMVTGETFEQKKELAAITAGGKGRLTEYQQVQIGQARVKALNDWKENNPPPVEPAGDRWTKSGNKEDLRLYKQELAKYEKKKDAFLSEYDSAVSGKSTEKESDLQSLIKAAGAGTKAAPDSASSSPKTTQVTEKVSRKALAKPVRLAKTMKDLEAMIPPREVSQQGIYKSDIPYPWETSDPLGRVGEFVSENITGRTQGTQEARLPRKGEAEITTALRAKKIGGKGLKGLSERNFLSMKLKAVYGKSMTDKQIADAILDGTLLGDK